MQSISKLLEKYPSRQPADWQRLQAYLEEHYGLKEVLIRENSRGWQVYLPTPQLTTKLQLARQKIATGCGLETKRLHFRFKPQPNNDQP